jgi:hypothetical protein
LYRDGKRQQNSANDGHGIADGSLVWISNEHVDKEATRLSQDSYKKDRTAGMLECGDREVLPIVA